MKRFREKIKKAAREQLGGARGILSPSGQEITISSDGIDEPRFRQKQSDGSWDYVLPGNKDYIPGDTIDKPQGGSGGGSGNQGGKGRGEEEFTFLLNYDEFLDIIFDDLQLPDLIKASSAVIESHKMRRAGYTTAGMPSNLNVERTAISGLSRRIALRGPKQSRIREIEILLETETDEEQIKLLNEELELLRTQANAIRFLDNVDLRYNNFVPQPKPITNAVMFCIMDVSYSMGEKEKIIAKKFFMLLYLFLQRQYKNIEVVFIRHHEEAEECDEATFFTSKESGGTLVSSAYELTDKIMKERYPSNEWNIYVSQASDGDNYGNDANHARGVLSSILKESQFMAYIEISRHMGELFLLHTTNLWDVIAETKVIYPQVELQKIYDESDVISVFRKFFAPK